jgi:alanyl-tRNA synthetase
VDMARRSAIQRHHTVTHLLHWALHEVVGREATQKGSYVGPEKLTFDFNSAALSEQQVRDIESLVNQRILENAGVSWSEASYQDVRQRPDIMQFFGDKYGDRVRVVQLGGQPGGLNGYSMELCGGTHCRATGEIGLFRVASESAVAAGVRRIEAVAGMESYRRFQEESNVLRGVASRINSPLDQVERKIESLLMQQKELERQVRTMLQERASLTAQDLIRNAVEVAGVPWIIANVGRTDNDTLQAVVGHLKGGFDGVAVLVGQVGGDKPVKLMALVGSAHTTRFQAGKMIQAVAPLVEGRGGGKPDFAQGGGANVDGIPKVIAAVEAMR